MPDFRVKHLSYPFKRGYRKHLESNLQMLLGADFMLPDFRYENWNAANGESSLILEQIHLTNPQFAHYCNKVNTIYKMENPNKTQFCNVEVYVKLDKRCLKFKNSYLINQINF